VVDAVPPSLLRGKAEVGVDFRLCGLALRGSSEFPTALDQLPRNIAFSKLNAITQSKQATGRVKRQRI
jgi:hypothetical protein